MVLAIYKIVFYLFLNVFLLLFIHHQLISKFEILSHYYYLKRRAKTHLVILFYNKNTLRKYEIMLRGTETKGKYLNQLTVTNFSNKKCKFQ